MRNSSVTELNHAVNEVSVALNAAYTHAPAELSELIRAMHRNLSALMQKEPGAKPMQLEAMAQSFAGILSDGVIPTESSKCGEQLRLAAQEARHAGYIADEVFEMGGTIAADALRELKRLPEALRILADVSDRLAMERKTHSSVQSAAETLPAGRYDRLSSEAAVRFCEALNRHARELGFPAVSAVCDAGGNLLALQRDDGALIASIDIAANKAYTAVSLKMTTEQLAELAAPGGSLYGIQHTNGGRIVIFGGGAPLYRGNELIGGFGVSGGTAAQDTEMAHYGARLAEQWFSE